MALPPDLERYRLYTAEDLDKFPPVQWLIPGHLAVGELTGLYGQGGAFKTFLALDWACHLAQHGHLVVYILAEGVSGMKARVGAWKKFHDVEALPALCIMPSNVALHDPKSVAAWLQAMALQLDDRRPELVVVDTLARNFVGGSENDARDMGMFVDGAERIRVRLHTAVLVLHHTTKDGKSERGTLALRNAAFAMFKLTRRGGGGVGTADLECDRMKDAPEPPKRHMAPQRVELPELGEGEASLVAAWPDYSPGPPPDQRAQDERKAGEYAGDYSPDEKLLMRAVTRANTRANTAWLAERLGWGRTKVNRVTKALVTLGSLEKHGTGRNTFYSPPGEPGEPDEAE
jgi:hypothetical protein